MLKNYFKIAFRNIWKQKGFSSINIVGLALGFACCLLIALYIQFEFSFDTFHQNSSNTYRIIREITGSGGEKRTNVPVNYSMADMLVQYFPEIEKITRFSRQSGKVSYLNQTFEEEEFYLAEPSFFEIFDVEFLSGNPEKALQQPFSAVITRETALNLFKVENPIGKSFEYEGHGPFTVTGIVRAFPTNSHFQFNILASLESTRSWLPSNAYTELGYNWIYTYLVLPTGYNPAELEQKIRDLVQQVAPAESQAFRVDHIIQPLEEIHLHSNFSGELQAGGNAIVIYMLMAIAGLILLIACFNYVNLSTARAVWRSREVGMRKTLGAGRGQLMIQFLGESILMVIIAFLVSLLILELVIPYFNVFSGRELQLDLINNSLLVWSILIILLSVGIAAGSYPAILMSGYSPSRVLKGQRLSTEPGRSGLFRKGMVVFQFAISIFLIAGTTVIFSQLKYTQNMEMGFEKEHVIVLNLSESRISYQQLEGFKKQIGNLNGITGVAAASDVPPSALNSWRLLPEGVPPDQVELMKVMAVDEDFINVMNIKLMNGRDFSGELISDREEAIILNEAAVKWLGLETPLGTRFNLMNNLKQGRVIGVVQNFHMASVHDEIAPVFLHLWPDWYDQLVVRIQPGDIKNTLSGIEKIWETRLSDTPFQFTFLDETFDALYRQEQRMAQVMTAGSSLAIFIACLGLVGLISFTVERRTREIGIRKVLGASMRDILGIFSGEFLKLFFTGFVIAVPFIWYIMNRWLQDFAYHIDIGPGIFVVSGGIAMVVTIASISFQVIKAAIMNPVESLKNE